MNLFSRIQPQKTFQITIEAVAKLLGIPPEMIVRIEKWKHVLFVHRRDIGGQFISYRQFKNWQNAVAMKIKNCYKHELLKVWWRRIQSDRRKYIKQYKEDYLPFVQEVFLTQWNKVFDRNREEFYARKNQSELRREEWEYFRW